MCVCVHVLPQPEHQNLPRKYLATVSNLGAEKRARVDKTSRMVSRLHGFLTLAAADLLTGPRAKAPRARRERHLLAVPAFGTGGGGGFRFAGALIQEYLKLIYRLVRGVAAVGTQKLPALTRACMFRHAWSQPTEQLPTLGVDVALCLYDSDTHAAAQAARRVLIRDGLAPAWPLSRRLLKTGRRLARLAVAGKLVLFLGAGVSVGAGLPMWVGLVKQLAKAVGIGVPPAASPGEARTAEQQATLERKAASRWKAFQELSLLDQARLIEKRLAASGRSLGHTVAGMLLSPHHSVAHALLAKMPVSEYITTNYDALYGCWDG